MTDVDISVRIAARPDTVFRFFTDPERMRAWMGETADIDPRPGGEYRVSVIDGNVAIGEYVEVVDNERLVWTWGWEGSDTVPPGSSVVEVTLTPDGDGTVVRLRHSGLPDDEAVNDHGRGWGHYTARLALAASGVDPGPDTGPAPQSEARDHAHMTEETQAEYAQRIARVLNLGVLQDAVAVGLEDQGQFKVDVLDLLDALQSSGLKLVLDPDGEVAAANDAMVKSRLDDSG